MSSFEVFAWGFAGSIAVEIVTLLGHYQSNPLRIPDRYRRLGFWTTRIALAGLAGAVAVGYGIEQRILAFNIGAATPLIIASLARGFRPRGPTHQPELPDSVSSRGASVTRHPAAGRRS